MNFKANRGLALLDNTQAAMQLVVSDGSDQAIIACRQRASNDGL